MGGGPFGSPGVTSIFSQDPRTSIALLIRIIPAPQEMDYTHHPFPVNRLSLSGSNRAYANSAVACEHIGIN